MASDQGMDVAGNAHAIVGCDVHALQEERGPTFPVSGGAHGRQPRVVLGLRPPERHAEVEQWLFEQAPVLDEQRDQQPPNAAVAVQERVDGLELHVREPSAHQRRQVAVGMPPPLQRRQRGRNVLGRRRNEAGGTRTPAADPVLRPPNLPRQLVAAADAAHQDAMGLAQKADAERQPVRIGEPGASVCEGVHVVAHLLDIFESLGAAGRVEGHHVRERGLHPFDLRGEYRLLADETVQEPIGARHHHACNRKSGQSGQCTGMKLRRRSMHGQRRVRGRQRIGNERANILSHGAGDAVPAGGACHCQESLPSLRPNLRNDRLFFNKATKRSLRPPKVLAPGADLCQKRVRNTGR